MAKNNALALVIEKKKSSIFAALPDHIDKEKYLISAAFAISKIPKLNGCTAESIGEVIHAAAETGLDFTSAKGHAYIIPFGKVATFIIGWKGYIDLAERSGLVRKIEARIVYKEDFFELTYGTSPDIKHRPHGDSKKRGKTIGAYAIGFKTNGATICEYMDLAELENIRSKSKAPNSPAWTQFTDEMYRKTVVRRLVKYLPSSTELQRAFDWENKMSGLKDASDAVDIDVPEDVTAEHINENVGDIPEAEVVEDDTSDQPELNLDDGEVDEIDENKHTDDEDLPH